MKGRRAYFFVIDAFLAMGLLAFILVGLYREIPTSSRSFKVYSLSKDYLDFLSKTKIRDLSLEYRSIIEQNISNPDLYITEALCELYYKYENGCDGCKNLINSFLLNITDVIGDPIYTYNITINKEEVMYIGEPEDKMAYGGVSKKIVLVMNGSNILHPYIFSVLVASK